MPTTPGNIIDGGIGTGGNVAQWKGPFDPGELHDRYDAYFTDVDLSGPVAVADPATAAGLLATDPGWWQIGYGQVIDGGTASSSSQPNIIDGGSA